MCKVTAYTINGRTIQMADIKQKYVANSGYTGTTKNYPKSVEEETPYTEKVLKGFSETIKVRESYGR